MEIARGILEAVGRTPLVRLDRLFADADLRLYAKLEALNPGGSIKDRPALEIIDDGIRSGAIGPDTVIIESSSGNMGIGLAQVCRYHDLRFICVVDTKTTEQNARVLEAYGAELERVTSPDPESGELLQARLKRVEELCRQIPDSFWPNQYQNRSNPASHYRTTMREIWEALAGRIDYLFIATSTCGTIRGCAEFIRDVGGGARIVAVDAVGSRIFDDQSGERLIPGLGAGLRPPLCDLSLVDLCVHVSDSDSVWGCRRLVEREAILAGGSSGAVVAGVEKMLPHLPPGARCVAILCDRGERYLDTIYSDEWVTAKLGSVERERPRAIPAPELLPVAVELLEPMGR